MATVRGLSDAMRRGTVVKRSGIDNGGMGLFIPSNDTHAPAPSTTTVVQPGEIVAWYVGKPLSLAEYFILDVKRSPLVDYAVMLPHSDVCYDGEATASGGTSHESAPAAKLSVPSSHRRRHAVAAICPPSEAFLQASDLLASPATPHIVAIKRRHPVTGEVTVEATTTAAATDDTTTTTAAPRRLTDCLAHFANDCRCITLDETVVPCNPDRIVSVTEALLRGCRRYIASGSPTAREASDPTASANVTIDFDSWVEGTLPAVLASRGGDDDGRPLATGGSVSVPAAPFLAFPVRAMRSIAPGEEVFLSYGLSYWASRAVWSSVDKACGKGSGTDMEGGAERREAAISTLRQALRRAAAAASSEPRITAACRQICLPVCCIARRVPGLVDDATNSASSMSVGALVKAGAFTLWDIERDCAVPDDDLFVLGCHLFGREQAAVLIRVKKIALRHLITTYLVSSSATTAVA